MSDFGIGKIGVFLLTIAGVVTISAVSDAIRSAAGVKTKVNAIAHRLKLMDKLSHCPSINELPLKRPIRWSKQINDGRSPCDSSYPKINLQIISDNSVVVTKKTGIW